MRDGRKDLYFQGDILAELNYSDGSHTRLYNTESGKFVLAIRDVDEEGTFDDNAQVFDRVADLVSYLDTRYGVFSYTMKSLFSSAQEKMPELRQYFAEEV